MIQVFVIFLSKRAQVWPSAQKPLGICWKNCWPSKHKPLTVSIPWKNDWFCNHHPKQVKMNSFETAKRMKVESWKVLRCNMNHEKYPLSLCYNDSLINQWVELPILTHQQGYVHVPTMPGQLILIHVNFQGRHLCRWKSTMANWPVGQRLISRRNGRPKNCSESACPDLHEPRTEGPVWYLIYIITDIPIGCWIGGTLY